MEIKNIVFDFGAVLIDWNPRYLYRTVFNDEDEMEHFLSEVCHLGWNQQLDLGTSFEEAIAERIKSFPQYEPEIKKYQNNWMEMIGGEIKENTRLIESLSQKYQLYGLTNWSAETFPLVYNQFDFFTKLKGIVVSGEEKLVKPDARIFNLLLERYELKAEETLFVDDNKANVDAAKSLGFKTIHFTDKVILSSELKKLGLLVHELGLKSISVHRYSVGIKS